MLNPTARMRGDEQIFGAEIDGSQVEPWDATIAQARDTMLKRYVVGPDYTTAFELLPQAKDYVCTQREVEGVSEMCFEAVTAGRLIDFGWWPNDVIKFGGTRGGELWNQGGLSMPFTEPWLVYHNWENGSCVYLINPVEPGQMAPTASGEIREAGEGFEVAELAPALLGGNRVLVIQDRGRVFKTLPDMPADKYWAHIWPSHARFWADPDLFRRANDGQAPEKSACGNIADPAMLALLMLGTRNVQRETIHAPEKLNRARLRNRKPPIPPYERVHSVQYVTAIANRGARQERGDDHGGTHRSPVAHLRMGHPRSYVSGRTIFIADTLVNVPKDQRETFKATRSHYDASRMDRP
jgi:hypothetical protein